MSKRRTADQIVRLLREAERDLAKGLTVSITRSVRTAPWATRRRGSSVRRVTRDCMENILRGHS